MIKYYLIENYLLKGDSKYMALVTNTETKNLNDIINMMIDEGTGLTRPQALAYFERLMQAIGFWLQNGYAVNTPLVKFRTSISGSFRDELDSFDTNRHQLNIRATPGMRMKTIITSTKLERSRVASQVPNPLTYIDNLTEEENAVASPGAIGIVRGNFLSFDKTDLQQGVFMVPVADPAAAVRVPKYSHIKPQEVHFLCPALTPGDYTVEIRAMSKNGKELLSGSLKSPLTVS